MKPQINQDGETYWFFRMPFGRILRIGWRNNHPTFWIYNPHTAPYDCHDCGKVHS